MLAKLRERVAVGDESGFTLIELLVVLIIIGVLLAIAVPSYLGFKDRAQQRAAQSDVRSAVPSAEAYFSDNNSYTGMTLAALQAIDGGIKLDAAGGVSVGAAGDTYCLQMTVGKYTAWVDGPADAAVANSGVIQVATPAAAHC